MKPIILLVLTLSLAFATVPLKQLPYTGIQVEHLSKGKETSITIQRIKPKECQDVATSPKNIWSGDWAAPELPKPCVKTFATVVGKIQPMVAAQGVKTVGELEVLRFMEHNLPDSEHNILVDARRDDWFETGTIPGATNIIHSDVEYDPVLEEDYYKTLEKFGISHKDGKLDFSKAKTAIIFCNGIWCPQSTWMIKNLLSLGYPAGKLMWYRGGMQDWRSVGLTTVR